MITSGIAGTPHKSGKSGMWIVKIGGAAVTHKHFECRRTTGNAAGQSVTLIAAIYRLNVMETNL